MGLDDSSTVLVTLVAVALCLLSLSLVAAGPAGAGTPLDGNDTNTTLTETVDNTTDTVNDTVSTTTDTVDDTTDTNTTDSVTDTVDSTTDTVSNTTDSTTDTVSNTTEQTTDAVSNTTSTTDSGSMLTVDDTDTLLSSNTSSTSDGDETELADEFADVTGALTGGITETTEGTVSGVVETTDTVVGEDGLLTAVGDTLVSGSTLSAPEEHDSISAGDGSGEDGSTAGGTAGPATTPNAPTEPPAAVEGPTPAPSGGDGPTGTLAALASRSLSESIPVTGQGAAGAGLAVGAAAAAGTVLLRGSSFTGTGVGRNTVRMARYGGQSAVRRAGAGALDRLFRIATFFRYSRYDDSDPLENETRAAVMDAVEADPGRPITEVAEAADVNLSTARYHVRVLQNEDVLMRVPVRGRKRLFPAFTQDPELLAALSDEATAPIVDALERLEPATVGALADELGKSPSTVTHHLQRLEEDGIVVRERDGRSVKNSLAPPAREALAPSAETEPKPAATAQSAD